jgi:hypothetical protein
VASLVYDGRKGYSLFDFKMATWDDVSGELALDSSPGGEDSVSAAPSRLEIRGLTVTEREPPQRLLPPEINAAFAPVAGDQLCRVLIARITVIR